MSNSNKHIDNIIREKFEHFAPSPPTHIWAGIESGLNLKPVIPFYKNKRIISTTIIALVVLIIFMILISPISFVATDSSSVQSSSTDESITLVSDDNEETIINTMDGEVSDAGNSDAGNIELLNVYVIGEPKSNNAKTTDSEIGDNTIGTKQLLVSSLDEPQLENKQSFNQISTTKSVDLIKLKKSAFVCPQVYNKNYYPETYNYVPSLIDGLVLQTEKNIVTSHWKVGYYLSPELSLSNFDSVQILNSYTISVEPTYFISEHWFVRFGVGLSYVSDRGFAKIDFVTNDYMGSYDDVYDITFDTTGGAVTPIYHTKTVEVWDSVHHVSVSNVTNKYIYLQIPALFGYYSKISGSNISWYLMGGPAFNIKVGSWIDNPKPDAEDADIISLQNNLPTRSDYYFQLWLGAGIEYQINKKLSLAVEPGYRYYFNSIYNNPFPATSSSGLTLRVGLVYLIK